MMKNEFHNPNGEETYTEKILTDIIVKYNHNMQ